MTGVVLAGLIVGMATAAAATEGENLDLICEQFEPPRAVYVRIMGDAGEIKMPPQSAPVIRSSSSDGWRPIKNLEVADDEISGSVVWGPLSEPKFQIDRISGHISIAGRVGAYGFFGTCRTQAVERKF